MRSRYRIRCIPVVIVAICVMMFSVSCGRASETSVVSGSEVNEQEVTAADKPGQGQAGTDKTQDSTVTEQPGQKQPVTGNEDFSDVSEQSDISAGTDIDRLARSTVRLEVFDDRDNRIATGSGFAAFDDTMLVTSCHVIVNMDYMIATKDDGSTFRIDRTVELNEDDDIAICILPEDAGLEPLTLKEKLPARGSTAFVISSQFGLVNLMTKGNIAGIWETDETSRIVFTAPVSGGSSGSPLFDGEGNVIGIVTGTYDKGQNLNLAAPVKAALTLYKSIIH